MSIALVARKIKQRGERYIRVIEKKKRLKIQFPPKIRNQSI